jgi:hypothetical protein
VDSRVSDFHEPQGYAVQHKTRNAIDSHLTVSSFNLGKNVRVNAANTTALLRGISFLQKQPILSKSAILDVDIHRKKMAAIKNKSNLKQQHVAES